MKFVVHCKKEKFDVYVGRPTIWGNPFSEKDNTLAEFKVSTREEAIQKFEEWIQTQPDLIQRVKQDLKDKVLGCWCHPKACHADILARIANEN